MNTNFPQSEREYDTVVEKLRALSARVRPEARHFHTILAALPITTKVKSPFSVLLWKILPVGVVAAMVLMFVGYTTLSPSHIPLSTAPTPIATTGTPLQTTLAKIESALAESATEEEKFAYADSADSYAAADSEDISTITSVYESYDYDY